MGDPLTPQVSERICKHMNEDHADAIALYARVFGQVEGVTQARMQAIDPEGMDLRVQVDGAVQTLRIRFDHPPAGLRGRPSNLNCHGEAGSRSS